MIQSRPRQARAEALLSRSRCREAAEQILADHEGHPRSICRHSNDDPVHGFWEKVFSVLMEPEKGLMWVSRGNPCSRHFEYYQLG